MTHQVAEKAWEIAEPILRNEGLELIDVDYLREGGRWVLRLFIDKPGSDEKGKGVDLEDCQKATHAVETAIEVSDVVPHEYTLEVSSPGIERPLTRPEHFQRFMGKRIQVRTFGPLFDPPRKSFTGKLVAFADDAVQVEVEGAGLFKIERKEIAKANLVAEWD
ncbi:MAG TPA: ribosome maturation factor RimP [Myxococcales bacterium]|jgi:ribosome maturation factor RimP